MKQRGKVIVVLPGFNAEKTLKGVYQAIPKKIVDEVILVDDCSKDRTVALAKKLGIRTLVHKNNKGYGANQKTCYKEALERGADFIIMLHPDGQYDPSDLSLFIEPLKNGKADLVLGSRFLGNKPCQTPFYKIISIKFITLLFNLILNTGLTDANTGYRGYTKSLLNALPFEKNGDGFIFDPQLLIQAREFGFNIREIPITKYYNDDASSITFFESIKHGLENISLLGEHLLSKDRFKKLLNKLTGKILTLQAVLLLSPVYFLFLPLTRLVSKNQIQDENKKAWKAWQLKTDSLEDCKKQF